MIKKLTILIIILLVSICYSASAGELTLQWTMNTEPDVKEYKVFKRIGSTTNYDYDVPYGTKQHIDCGVFEAGKCEITLGVSNVNVLHFVVRAYDDLNRSSANSNEVVFDPAVGPNFLTFTWLDATIYAYPVYFGTTDKSITVNWSASPGAVAYEYVLYDIFKKVNTNIHGETANTTVTFQLPKTGSYELKVRAKLADQTYEAWITIQGRYVGWPGGGGGIIIGISRKL